MIDGRTFSYNTVLDAIYEGQLEPRRSYDRTHVNVPVDLCIEVTTRCNLACANCFAECSPKALGRNLPLNVIRARVRHAAHRYIRVCITGGEPLLHPDIEGILELPREVAECGFVLSTNGTLRNDLDAMITSNNWLVAISLHGNRTTHNGYTRSDSFQMVLSRIQALAPLVPVHIYCVVSNLMTVDDVTWLYAIRDTTRVAFLRFIMPLPIGRHEETRNSEVIRVIEEHLDDRSGLKTHSSLTHFLASNGEQSLLGVPGTGYGIRGTPH